MEGNNRRPLTNYELILAEMFNNKFILIAILVSALYSCNAPQFTTSDQMRSQYFKALHGTWLNHTYKETIEKLRSPYLAQKQTDYHLFFIDTTLYQNNYLTITDYYYGQTEISLEQYFYYNSYWRFQFAYSAFQNFRQDTCTQNCHLLDFRFTQNDTILIYRLFDKQTGRYYNIEYYRLPYTCGDSLFLCQLDMYLNELIIAGNYQIQDSANVCQQISIFSNGIVIGLQDIDRMQVWNFFGDLYHRYTFDIVELYPRGYGGRPYTPSILCTPEFDGDTLKLFNIKDIKGELPGQFYTQKDSCLFKLVKLKSPLL